MSFNAIRENKILEKISESTVLCVRASSSEPLLSHLFIYLSGQNLINRGVHVHVYKYHLWRLMAFSISPCSKQ